MKRHNIIGLVLMFLTILACTKEPEYTIQGSVPSNQFDGEWIYLVPYTNHRGRVDSVRIENATFSFTGDSAEVKIVRVRYGLRDQLQDLIVVTEPGLITVKMDTLSQGGGTPQNEVLQQWKDHIVDYNKALLPIWQRAKDAIGADSLIYAAKIDSIKTETQLFHYNLLKGCQGSIAGEFILQMVGPTLTYEQILDLNDTEAEN